MKKIRDIQFIGEALIILALPSALPIPTGGIAHSLSILIIIISLWGLILRGIRPDHQLKINKGKEKVLSYEKAKAFHDKVWHYAGKVSKPRFSWLFNRYLFTALTGLFVIICAICFWTIVPLADTPPSVAVVLFGFALVYKDILIWLSAVIVGTIGVVINVGTLTLIFTKAYQFIQHLF